MNSPWQVSGEALTKAFNRRIVFREITFSVSSGQTLIITGPNGSGKSTLAKIIAGVLTPTSGAVRIRGSEGEADDACPLGFVSPYLQMFEEFSAVENLKLSMGIRGLEFDAGAADGLLDRVRLHHRKDDPVRTFSSGMKQRLKYAFAMLHHPRLLILDEPMSNLDDDGASMVRTMIREHLTNGVLVVATNDPGDLDGFDRRVELHDPR